LNAKGVGVPAAVSVFPDELYACPKTWAEKAFPKLIHFNELERGSLQLGGIARRPQLERRRCCARSPARR
jgi:hypothetical protein